MFWRRCIPLPLLLALTGCFSIPKNVQLEKFFQDFIGTSLALDPVGATEAGFHKYQEVTLDGVLNDYSERGVRGLRVFFNSMHSDATGLDSTKLDVETRADLDLIEKFCEMQLLELDKIQSYKHNPAMYVELIGRAINGPFTLSYAPENERFRNIISRLNHIPEFLTNARANLTDSPKIWNEVAQSEDQGNIDLIDHQVRSKIPAALEKDYDAAASKALAAIHEFDDWLKNSLSKHESNWRLGHTLYAEKFRYALANGLTPEQTLADAETELEVVRRDMKQQALSLWPRYFPGKQAPSDTNAVIVPVLDKIAQQHSTPEGYIDDARRDLAESTQFVKDHHLLSLPAGNNLRVIPTPEFMRGLYAVGGFQPAPVLQPELGAFYWVTPLTKDMPKEAVESELRENNFYGLKILTIHEAMPGHYVQSEYANQVQPKTRGVLRALLAGNPYVEGWAVYATQMMIDQGYQPVPEMKLTFGKQILRVIVNTILDVKMQTQGMTDQQALDLMIQQTFQERQEAVAKVRRAKLSSCQLPTYFVGWRAWNQLKNDYQKKKGSAFRLSEFNERALKEGSLPMSVLQRVLLQ